ncbi:MAG: MFS transporter, partial [Lachnospiraceae bacterium]|nr:MFS transporter [Lachnospiraceae bacterium]
YAANQQQNPAVLSVIRHSFTTVPGVLWIVTAAVLYFYRLNKKAYNKIVQEIQERKGRGKKV